MKCTIGIPAHNEETTLPVVLESLRQQHLPGDVSVSIIVVANGCSDDTVHVALRFGLRNFGEPKFCQNERCCHWDFGDPFFSFSVYEVALASKSNALNIIHSAANGGVVLFFDADVCVQPEVVKAMYQALLDFPQYGAVAIQYCGIIPPLDESRNCLFEWWRLQISKAINHFDQYSVRLDGKGYGYLHSLIKEHPSLIPVDMWLEGVSWRHSSGCVYLRHNYIEYRLPKTFEELVAQYIRYNRSIRVFSNEYPELFSYLQKGRKQSNRSITKPTLRHRLVGWLFFNWIAWQARHITEYDGGEKWEVILSTKTWN